MTILFIVNLLQCSVQVKNRCGIYMFQEDYEEYLQGPQNFSHLDVVPDLLMEAMQKVRDGMHEMKEELTMLKSEIDEKSKTRKKITVFVLVVVVLCIVWKALK